MSEATAAAESGVGSVSGAALHIAIRDAKLAGGATVEEAEAAATAMVAMLHTAEKEGPEAVARAMAEIQRILDAASAGVDAIGDDLLETFGGLSVATTALAREAGLNFDAMASEWAGMSKEMREEWGTFEEYVKARLLVKEAGLNFSAIEGRWAAMTEAQQKKYGSFEAYIEGQIFRKMARDAGVNFADMRGKWNAMTDAQQKRYGSFEKYMREQALRKMAREAGLKFRDMRNEWNTMTDDQQSQYGSFADYVQSRLDDLPATTETDVTGTVTYDDPGFDPPDQHLTVHVRYDDPGSGPSQPSRPSRPSTPRRRQHGGPVVPGTPYIVGEGGVEELFVPNQAGTILPRVPSTFGSQRPIDITLQIDGRTLNAELIRVHENTVDFYGQ